VTSKLEQRLHTAWAWCCLHCGGSLASAEGSFECAACGRRYPVIGGVPILVREPDHYLCAERAAVAQTLAAGHRSREHLDQLARATGLPEATISRHCDVIDTEIAHAVTFLELVDAAQVPIGDSSGTGAPKRTSGWALEALVPYLLRDWNGTSELAAAASRIDAALARAFADRSEASVVFAACGAGGILAAIEPVYGRVLGFDLTLPVLLAARRLLDGKQLDIALPRCINAAGRITLHPSARPSAGSAIELAAMDAFDTAFAHGSVDCVVTSFLIDLLPDPRPLAREIHRMLRSDGVWINYGPSGPLKALWRFDRGEASGFVEGFGFTVTESEAYRATYLDLSRDCPAWSFQNHICYLTCARKSGELVADEATRPSEPAGVELQSVIPEHFRGAELIERQSLGPEGKRSTHLRHEGVPGRPQSMEVGVRARRVLALVDGHRTVGEIAELLARENPSESVDETLRAFDQYFSQGLLNWRSR
jgi:SAM-dependent methyltransferase